MPNARDKVCPPDCNMDAFGVCNPDDCIYQVYPRTSLDLPCHSRKEDTMGEDTTVKPPVNAHIGTYKNATQRQDVRVLTHLCSCGAIMAIVLNNDEVPDENLCTRCWMYGQLTYEEDDPDALL